MSLKVADCKTKRFRSEGDIGVGEKQEFSCSALGSPVQGVAFSQPASGNSGIWIVRIRDAPFARRSMISPVPSTERSLTAITSKDG